MTNRNTRILAALLIAPVLSAAGCKATKTESGDAPQATQIFAANAVDVPPVVQAAFVREHPDASATKISKRAYFNGMVHYHYAFVAGGKAMQSEYDWNGTSVDVMREMKNK